ncbi:MAG: MerR family transcriptional regulator [Tissierellia bacterium]|nr:MerR family transcriptional regulator [Tissierellia bacterium]
MEYTISKLAKMSGISSRTLRYYDEIGLLKPKRLNPNGYRIYGELELNLLQQILFYKELGLELNEIKDIIYSPSFNLEEALEEHLIHLQREKERIELLIQNVNKTIRSLKGEAIMKDTEKFEGFKKEMIKKNELEYGAEAREKYGDEAVDASNAKLANVTKEEWESFQELTRELNEKLRIATREASPGDELAQEVCELHRQWLCFFWEDENYSKEAHLGLGRMYVEDERFKKYYEDIAEGAAEFLYEALKIYCK